ncbi:MAG TPA: hypothetical protein VGC41_22410 [Kofleriaceae bacterium]
MTTFHDASWTQIQALRASLDETTQAASSLQEAAQHLAVMLATTFESCVLARVFALVPLHQLPAHERLWAESFAGSMQLGGLVKDQTPVMTLLGTAGVEIAWSERTSSQGHRAIPLVDSMFIERAPMIAALLDSLQIGPELLHHTGDMNIRTFAGGLNARFFVDDAKTSLNAAGKHVIASRPFVEKYGVKSVFGMGGSYVTGTTVFAVVFTNETLTATEVDRFTSFIGTFKLATTANVEQGQLF